MKALTRASQCQNVPYMRGQPRSYRIPPQPLSLQVLVATGEGNIVLLEVVEARLSELSHTQLASDIACLDVTPLGSGQLSASLAAVGTWDHHVHILRVPDLSSSAGAELLGEEALPRSALFAEFESIPYLLVALGVLMLLPLFAVSSLGASADHDLCNL